MYTTVITMMLDQWHFRRGGISYRIDYESMISIDYESMIYYEKIIFIDSCIGLIFEVIFYMISIHCTTSNL